MKTEQDKPDSALITDASHRDGPQCLVVMYHYVHDRETLPLPAQCVPKASSEIQALSTSDFRVQIEGLARELEPIDWPRLFAWCQGRGSIPKRCFLLTFDDGLADHAAHVLPILEEHGLHGVFFVPGAVLATRCMLPAHALHLLLSVVEPQTIERQLTEFLRAQAGGDSRSCFSPDEEAARALYHYEPPERARLKYLFNMSLPQRLRNPFMERLFERFIGSPQRWAKHWYLHWDDLIRMQSQGHTVGGHGFSHNPYSRLTVEEVRTDLRKVATILRDGLGPEPRPLSYPFGRANEKVVTACRAVGFAQAFTTESRRLTRSDDPYRLPRVDTIAIPNILTQEFPCPPVF